MPTTVSDMSIASFNYDTPKYNPSFEVEINGAWYKFIVTRVNIESVYADPDLTNPVSNYVTLRFDEASCEGRLIPIAAEPTPFGFDPMNPVEPEPEKLKAIAEFRDW